jgi:competence protein ComEC
MNFSFKRKLVFFILGILFFLNFLAWQLVFDFKKPHYLEVNFFDLGQGEAIFIETPRRYQILIDGGGDSTILKKLRKKMPFWDRSLDLVILTHPDHDHLAGLIEVLKRYKVDHILWTGVLRDNLEYREWQKVIKKEKAKIKIAQAGQKIKTPKISLKILHPFENLAGKKFKNNNNTSIVARLSFKDNSFLFTGDIYQSVEKKLIIFGQNLNSDVLKVSHHGSKTSSSKEFLEKVLPKIAIIQVGKNIYGHPHKEVLKRLKEKNIKILRTDEVGDIKILSDGNNLKILTSK